LFSRAAQHGLGGDDPRYWRWPLEANFELLGEWLIRTRSCFVDDGAANEAEEQCVALYSV